MVTTHDRCDENLQKVATDHLHSSVFAPLSIISLEKWDLDTLDALHPVDPRPEHADK
ncbi:hypothetical protein D3C84_1214790 [compost metagenome]